MILVGVKDINKGYFFVKIKRGGDTIIYMVEKDRFFFFFSKYNNRCEWLIVNFLKVKKKFVVVLV